MKILEATYAMVEPVLLRACIIQRSYYGEETRRQAATGHRQLDHFEHCRAINRMLASTNYRPFRNDKAGVVMYLSFRMRAIRLHDGG